ncbi:exodeoxyribonuclease VII large subunit [Allohahella marinimesophila]|uniref:Exodeoxyribonuclease 7 large subunit n=1 Tax=Allohahella marinimesophila TaxID=1054972 RepID=A0ABP7NNF8_9GAMM
MSFLNPDETAASPGSSEQQPLSVSALNLAARMLLENTFGQVWIVGEISNFICPASGHWYFTLKDDAAQVRCAMFRNRNTSVRWKPANGQSVLICARASIYENRGEYQLVANAMLDAGAGSLQQAFDQLKRKLETEGLFDPLRKRDIPAMPAGLGVVTSDTGAALHDILHVLKRRCPLLPVKVFASTVQGDTAVGELMAALHCADRDPEVELIIIGRGGGSAEDLWCFNDERLARAIAACNTPVISAVGHETDVTISDLVADLRAPTPSAAAEHASPVQADWLVRAAQLDARQNQAMNRVLRLSSQAVKALCNRLQHPGQTLERHSQTLDQHQLRLESAMERLIFSHKRHMSQLSARFNAIDPARPLRERRQRVDELLGRLSRCGQQSLQNSRQQFLVAARQLEQLSPLATMNRGYAIVSTEAGGDDVSKMTDSDAMETRGIVGAVVSSIKQLDPGDRLTVRLKDGQAECLVEHITDPGGD